MSQRMTPDELKACLEEYELNQKQLSYLISYVGGGPIDYQTVNRWATGRYKIPASASAFIRSWKYVDPIMRFRVYKEVAYFYSVTKWQSYIHTRLADLTKS